MSTFGFVVKVADVNAKSMTRFKDVTEDGGVIQRVVWRVARPVSPTDQSYEYCAAA